MFTFELQEIHRAELLAEADSYRLVKQLREAHKEERRAARNAAEGRVSPPRDTFDRAA